MTKLQEAIKHLDDAHYAIGESDMTTDVLTDMVCNILITIKEKLVDIDEGLYS